MFDDPNPRHRYDEVVEGIESGRPYDGEDSYQDALTRLFMNSPDVPYEVKYAADIFSRDFKREGVEALLLAKADAKDIYDTVRVPVDVIMIYQHLFFDVDVFRDRFDRIAYAENYPERVLNGDAARLKKNAVYKGQAYLQILLSGGEYTVSPTQVAREAINQAYMIGMQGKEQPLGSKASEGSRRWISTALQSIGTLPDLREIDSANADNEIQTKLEVRRKQLATEASVNGEVVNPNDIVIDIGDGDEDG